MADPGREVRHWDNHPRGGKSNNYCLGWSDVAELIRSHWEHSVLSVTAGGAEKYGAPGDGSSDLY